MGFQLPKSPTPRAPAHLGTWNSKGYWIPTLQLCKSNCAFVELKLQGPLNSKSPTPQLPARLRTWGLGTQRATGFQLCNFASPTPCALGYLKLKGPLNSKCATPQLPCALGELGSWNSVGLLPFTQRVLHKINQPSILAARIYIMLNHIEGKVIRPAETPNGGGE